MRSCKWIRLLAGVEVDGVEVRGKLTLPPEHEDFSSEHVSRAAAMSFSGIKNMSAGLTATRQAQMTVTLASITAQRMPSTVCPGELSPPALTVEIQETHK